ncbi:MAG: cellulase family glycosylhydrolase [Clostridia bacterium]|nr:cellulase family glycosylhydrolase [Clostridia bacterium]
MKKEFLIGCNYWASNAGTEMWRQWEPETVREDLKVLSENGVEYMRVFPNWRDFQPMTPICGSSGKIVEYRMPDNSKPSNPEFLDETMLARFDEFCDLCDAFGIKLVVGLITGFMSGETYIPPALFGKPLHTDPFALLTQQRFVRGFVNRFKHRDTIYAWDLGNECNNLGGAQNENDATNWSMIISNAIRAADPTRPVVSGMHGLVPGGNAKRKWTMAGQAETCDILTTHPYPYWVQYANQDPMLSMRTALHATCENKYYADIGGKPCLVEEIGSMGPMVCSEENAAGFMRVNLFSNWIHGALGVMWWCANEQDMLNHTPYVYQMCEIELGMRFADGSPKPVLTETGRVSRILKTFDFELSKAREDAVCITTRGQDQWGMNYMACVLAKQAGLNLRYAYGEDELPEAKVYMMPSVTGGSIMRRDNYLKLQEKVKEGATLYISNDVGVLAGFEQLTGLHIEDSCAGRSGSLVLDGETILFNRNRQYNTVATTAEVLAYDDLGIPAVSINRYGKGKVIYVNFPLETMLLHKNEFTNENYYKIYRKVFAHVLAEQEAGTENPFIGLTFHPEADGSVLCAAVNYSKEPQAPSFVLKKGWKLEKVLYGNEQEIPAFDACFFRIKKV